MTRPRSYQTEAIVIKKTKLREADRILTLYTPDMGKIQAVAKGVRRTKSKMAGHLEMLTHSQISLARGRNLDTIIGSQTINSFLPVKNDLWLTSYALYATELVNLFTAERDENLPLFDLLIATIKRLCDNHKTELVLRYFELHLLAKVGYRPQLQRCVICHKPLQPTVNHFSPVSGGILCPDCAPKQPASFSISVNALKILRLMQNSDYKTASRLVINQNLATEIENVLRRNIKYLLERDVKSISWLDELREQIKVNPPPINTTLG